VGLLEIEHMVVLHNTTIAYTKRYKYSKVAQNQREIRRPKEKIIYLDLNRSQ